MYCLAYRYFPDAIPHWYLNRETVLAPLLVGEAAPPLRCGHGRADGVGIVTPKRLAIAAEIVAASPPIPREAGRDSSTGGRSRPASPLGD